MNGAKKCDMALAVLSHYHDKEIFAVRRVCCNHSHKCLSFEQLCRCHGCMIEIPASLGGREAGKQQEMDIWKCSSC